MAVNYYLGLRSTVFPHNLWARKALSASGGARLLHEPLLLLTAPSTQTAAPHEPLMVEQ